MAYIERDEYYGSLEFKSGVDIRAFPFFPVTLTRRFDIIDFMG